MPSFREQPDDSSHDDWVDDELRQVPVPEEFLARLKAIATSDDEQLDAALRNVPLPKGLLLKLRGIVNYENDHLDAQLKEVPLPDQFLEKLGAISSTAGEPVSAESPSDELLSDEQLDTDLRSVPVPSGMLDNLRQIASPVPQITIAERVPRQHTASWQQLVIGLSLVLVIVLSYLSPMVRLLSTSNSTTAEKPSMDPVVPSNSSDLARDLFQPSEPFVVSHPEHGTLPSESLIEFPGPRIEIPHSVNHQLVETPRSSAYLTNEAGVESAPLRVVSRRSKQGIAPPWFHVDVLTELIKTGAHPFVSPADHPKLQTRSLPLQQRTDSFDWARRVIPKHRLKKRKLANLEAALAKQIRVEDFLQAMDYDFPLPLGANQQGPQMALLAYGGTSPFGSDSLQMLQLGVQAARVTTQTQPPSHFTVILDTSLNLQNEGSMDQLRTALRRWIGTLGPRDELSLFTTSNQGRDNYALLKRCDRNDQQSIAQAIDSIQLTSTTNPVHAIRQASDLNRQTNDAPDQRQILVFLTDGLPQLRNEGLALIEQQLVSLTQDQVAVRVAQLPSAIEDVSRLSDLAKACQGQFQRTGDAEQIFFALREFQTGQSLLVGTKVHLEITFDPESVVEYRLLGHEAATIVGHDPAPLTIDLRSAQAASVLLEMKLHPTAGDQVATARLFWQRPGEEKVQIEARPISRRQFAESYEESAISLQTAILAAETAEWLRRSVHAPHLNRSLDQVRRLAQWSHPQVLKNSSVRRLLELVKQAEKAGL